MSLHSSMVLYIQNFELPIIQDTLILSLSKEKA